jgi:hypothetical protein
MMIGMRCGITTLIFGMTIACAGATVIGVGGFWVEAEDLRAGDRLMLADGSEAMVEGVISEDNRAKPQEANSSKGIKKVSKYNVLEPTFNVEVDKNNTYYVSKNGIWVHNNCNYADR